MNKKNDENNLTQKEEKEIQKAGVEVKKAEGLTVIKDRRVVRDYSRIEGVEVGSVMNNAEMQQYFWQLINRDKDEYTREADKELDAGYAVRAKAGVRTTRPVYTCLYISKKGLRQRVHNIIVAEKGSNLEIVTGCLSGESAPESTHIGITEIFVEEGARVVFTMIHNWREGSIVRPRSAARVAKGGEFISNYVCLERVADIQMYPDCYLEGEDSRGVFNSVLEAREGSKLDIGGRIYFRGKNSRGEIKNRSVSRGGQIWARGQMVGEASSVKGHLECKGLMLSDKGMIWAIPEITAREADVDLTHEAAIGKISEEAIEYLMSRGISRDEAVGLIVRGFLDVREWEGLEGKVS